MFTLEVDVLSLGFLMVFSWRILNKLQRIYGNFQKTRETFASRQCLEAKSWLNWSWFLLYYAGAIFWLAMWSPQWYDHFGFGVINSIICCVFSLLASMTEAEGSMVLSGDTSNNHHDNGDSTEHRIPGTHSSTAEGNFASSFGMLLCCWSQIMPHLYLCSDFISVYWLFFCILCCILSSEVVFFYIYLYLFIFLLYFKSTNVVYTTVGKQFSSYATLLVLYASVMVYVTFSGLFNAGRIN